MGHSQLVYNVLVGFGPYRVFGREMAEYNLWLELRELTQRLDETIADLRACGQELAAAERAYKVKLREVATRLKVGGMAVGMIQLTVYGQDDVAKLRERRDVAEYFYEATREAIMSYKLQIRVLNEQINREVSAPNVGYGSL